MNKICQCCGSYVPDNANYCPTCGYDLGRGPRPATPPPYTRGYDNNNPFDSSGPEGKSRGVAALLAIFLGSLGVHYFYCNKVLAGVVCILISCCTCFTVWPLIMLVQGVYMLCITNEEFEMKYVATQSSFPVF